VPFTFVAAQAPVLAVGERFPRVCDGVALVVGTMAPDLAYVSRDWSYGPNGLPLWFDGHRFQNLLVLSIGTFVVTLLVRRVILPVLPVALPDGGVLHLHDFQNLATRRHRWFVTYLSGLAGAMIRLAINVFVHPDEPVVEHVAALRATVGSIGSWHIHVWSLIELASSVIFAVVTVRWLVRVGRERAFGPPAGEQGVSWVPAVARWAFWGVVALGCAGGVLCAIARAHVVGSFVALDSSTAVIDFSWVAFAGLLVGSIVVRPFVRVEPAIV
jgi:hypothetical protein